MPLFRRRPKPIKIESPDQIEELARTGLPVFVEFMQFNCNPCQVMDGVVNELAEEFDGVAHVVKVDAAHVPGAFDRFKVKSTPTFL
ncbi:MAG: thioredoxin family protein, partial [Acidimicrobiia bacterium]|nr:thioredoxin family protein [Acidimicrobiia bacterium]